MAWVGARAQERQRPGGTLLYAVLHLPWAVFSFAVAVTSGRRLGAADVSAVVLGVPDVHRPGRASSSYGDDDAHGFYLDTPFEIALTALVGLLLTLATPWMMRALTRWTGCMVARAARAVRGWPRGWCELESDRGVVVDTAAADLRRIERDLHDGAQARLVALAMDLGLAKEKLTGGPAGRGPDGGRGARRGEDRHSRSCGTWPAASTRPC